MSRSSNRFWNGSKGRLIALGLWGVGLQKSKDFDLWRVGRLPTKQSALPSSQVTTGFELQATGDEPLELVTCHWTPTCYSESKFLKVNSPRCVGELTAKVNSRSEIRTKLLSVVENNRRTQSFFPTGQRRVVLLGARDLLSP